MFHAFGHGAGFGFGLGFLNLIGTVLFILLVVYAVNALMRGGWRARWSDSGWRPGPWGGPGPRWSERGERFGGRGEGLGPFGADEAARIARERLASGEITAEEYEALKRGLGSQDEAGWHRHDPALRIARARFARGEMGLEEFQALVRALQG